MKLEKRTVNSVDLDETSSLIRVYTVCTGIDFGLLDFKDYLYNYSRTSMARTTLGP